MGRGTVDTVTVVRREVRRLLEASRAYRELPADVQHRLAEDMVRVGVYLAEPEGIPANGLAGAIAAVPAKVGGRTDLLSAVNFPAFVAGLIQAVFDAIVGASIQQMDAYGDLLKSVAQMVLEFAAEGIPDEAARVWLERTYPGCFERDADCGGLRLRSGADCAEALSRLRLLPLQGSLLKLGPEAIEKKLLAVARRRLAVSRQQLLATMVMMGINRIVVTDGKIRAGTSRETIATAGE
jgi:hypothetical protein